MSSRVAWLWLQVDISPQAEEARRLLKAGLMWNGEAEALLARITPGPEAAPGSLLSVTATSPLNDVIALPKFKVYENRPRPNREKWDYGRVSNFETLLNSSARLTC
jgi:hypothetical protein